MYTVMLLVVAQNIIIMLRKRSTNDNKKKIQLHFEYFDNIFTLNFFHIIFNVLLNILLFGSLIIIDFVRLCMQYAVIC